LNSNFQHLTLAVWGEKGDIKVFRITKEEKEVENTGYIKEILKSYII